MPTPLLAYGSTRKGHCRLMPLIFMFAVPDEALTRLINGRDYVAVIGPRLSGKSSMLLHQWARLRDPPLHIPVYLSLGQFRICRKRIGMVSFTGRSLGRPMG